MTTDRRPRPRADPRLQRHGLARRAHRAASSSRSCSPSTGRPLDAATYERELAGMSDPEIVWAWLGRDHPAAAAGDRRARPPLPRAHGRRLDGARAACAPRCAWPPSTCRSPICSGRGAQRDRGRRSAPPGDRDVIDLIVAAEDVPRGKPAPDGYLEAHRLLAPELPAGDVLVFEDTEVGVVSALAAGLRCIAVLGTMGAERLQAAERVVPELDAGRRARGARARLSRPRRAARGRTRRPARRPACGRAGRAS